MPVSSLSAGAFPVPLHVPAPPEDHRGALSCMQASGNPTASMGVGERSMDISRMFCIGRKLPKDLAKRKLYIEYFPIEVFIYFPIDESSQCALGRKYFVHVSIFLVDIFFFFFFK